MHARVVRNLFGWGLSAMKADPRSLSPHLSDAKGFCPLSRHGLLQGDRGASAVGHVQERQHPAARVDVTTGRNEDNQTEEMKKGNAMQWVTLFLK